ncbi:MAG: hypothetical protein VXY23_11750 [Pseudomonadota bacterium]|nr:hypothetical protein [Pseudomonadota bacterium]
MNTNNYRTPESLVVQEVKGSSIKAILSGLAVDVGGSILAGIIYAALYGYYLASTGIPLSEIGQILENSDFTSPFGIGGAVLGFVFTFLGGYVCAKKSVTNVYRDVSILCLLTVSFGWVVGQYVDVVQHLILSVFTAASAFFGGYVGKPRNV